MIDNNWRLHVRGIDRAAESAKCKFRAPPLHRWIGCERLVLVSVEEYHRLKRRDRRALAVEDLSAEQIVALEKARMPKGHEHLDAELKDWRP
jgi:hypothetical protein